MDTTTTLADRIRARLAALNKNPSAVALEAGLSRSAVLDILKGKAASPRLDTLKKLTRPLQCSLDYLTGATDEPDDEAVGAKAPTASTHMNFSVMWVKSPMVLEVGAFRDGPAASAPRGQVVAYRDIRRPDLPVSAARMQDNGLNEYGINFNDLLHFLEYDQEPIQLRRHMVVIVKRSLGTTGLQEYSARLVMSKEQQDDLFVLYGGPVDKHNFVLSLMDENHPAEANHYLTMTGETVEIVGVVCRTVRQMPI